MKTLTLAAALKKKDPKTVRSIDALTGPVDGLEQFTSLTRLSLSGNSDVSSFGFLTELEILEELYLENLELSDIPREVTSLKKLHTLFIGRNKINSFALLKKLPALVDLGLEEMGLRKVPDDVLSLKKLKVLGLADNSIGSLSSLKALTNLESLYAGNNSLKKVPKELTKLKKLRFLDVMGNWSIKDCDVVSELSALEELSICSGYEMERFPAGLFKLSELRKLQIYVHTKSAADAVAGLAKHELLNLEELSIENSKLKSIPDTLSSMKKLKRVTFKRNENLTNVDAIRDLPELAELNLESNEIESIGEEFSSLKKLQTLNLNHNNLNSVSGLRDLPELRELHLFSELKKLPETLGTLEKLEVLNLSAKGGEVSFLAKLKNLRELYIAGCAFDALPKLLGKTVKKLTVYRKIGDDSYLADFRVLEDLKVDQPSFTLPKMSALTTLSVGRVEDGVHLKNIAKCKSLTTFHLHRTDTMEALPAELSTATQLRHLELEFFDVLADVSALAALVNLETLKIRHCDVLPSLTAVGSKPKLKDLNLYALPSCTELDVVASWKALESLTLRRVEALPSLPDGLADLPNLSKVRLNDVDALKDISVFERCEALVDFEADGDGPSRKSIAKVMSAIDGRMGGSSGLKTSYATFMKSMFKKMSGKEDASHTYGFPLWFDTPETLLDAIEGYSWLDDYRYDDDNEWGEILTDPDHGLKPLAVMDLGYEGCNTYIDSYSEEIFLVDTESPMNPILLWGHDSTPREIYKSFDAFLANLRKFVAEGEDADDADES